MQRKKSRLYVYAALDSSRDTTETSMTEQAPQQLFEECRVKFEDEELIRMLDESAVLNPVLKSLGQCIT
jgi:hypothetical protein